MTITAKTSSSSSAVINNKINNMSCFNNGTNTNNCNSFNTKNSGSSSIIMAALNGSVNNAGEPVGESLSLSCSSSPALSSSLVGKEKLLNDHSSATLGDSSSSSMSAPPSENNLAPLIDGLVNPGHVNASASEKVKKKKARTTFTGRQIFELEKQFEIKKYLSSSERAEMAKLLTVTETQVSYTDHHLERAAFIA